MAQPLFGLILANCLVGDDNGNLPVPSSCSASTTLLISSLSGGASAGVTGGFTGVGCCWDWAKTSDLVLTHLSLSCLPFLGVTLFLAMLEFRQKEDQPIRRPYDSGLMRVTWQPSWICFLCDIITKRVHSYMVEYFFTVNWAIFEWTSKHGGHV